MKHLILRTLGVNDIEEVDTSSCIDLCIRLIEGVLDERYCQGLLDGRGHVGWLDWRSPDALWILYEAEEILETSSAESYQPELSPMGGGVRTSKGTIIYCGDRDGAILILAKRAGLSLKEWVSQGIRWSTWYNHFVGKLPDDNQVSRVSIIDHAESTRPVQRYQTIGPVEDTRPVREKTHYQYSRP